MSNFKPIKQFRVSEEVLNQLKEAILLGEFKSGEKLPSERELTMEFQVSRGVIREAIRALEITGFVETRQGPNGGSFVTDLSFDHLENAFLDLFLSNRLSIPELVNVRHYIEPEVARLAALNSTTGDKNQLIAAQKKEFEPWNSIPERVKRHQKVHMLLAEICGNHFFEAIVKSMLKLTREIVGAVNPDHKALHVAGEHKHIVEAVTKGNSEDAAREMRKHLDKFGVSLIEMEKVYRQRSAGE